jgi:hypothetical protein
MKHFFCFAVMVLSSLVIRAEEIKEEIVAHAGVNFRVVRLLPSSVDVV